MARLNTHRFSWIKRASAASSETWFETLAHLGPQRVLITEPAGARTALIQALGLSRQEAESLRKSHGGAVREARWLTALNPPQRAPIRIRGKLAVVSTKAEKVAAERAGKGPALWIPAGLAFGTGEHATTAMCLRHLADIAAALPPETWDFLDLGTGSAILAMAARCLGAHRALGTDFDAVALKTARENVRNNALSKIQLQRSDVLAWKPPKTWPVIAANLFSGILIEAAPIITSALAPKGHLILSGILREQETEVLRAFRKQGLRFLKITRRGKWISARATLALSSSAGRSAPR